MESVLKVVLDLDGIVVELTAMSPPGPPSPPPEFCCLPELSAGTSLRLLYFLMMGPHLTEFSK